MTKKLRIFLILDGLRVAISLCLVWVCEIFFKRFMKFLLNENSTIQNGYRENLHLIENFLKN